MVGASTIFDVFYVALSPFQLHPKLHVAKEFRNVFFDVSNHAQNNPLQASSWLHIQLF